MNNGGVFYWIIYDIINISIPPKNIPTHYHYRYRWDNELPIDVDGLADISKDKKSVID
jgi:hypothetical protein